MNDEQKAALTEEETRGPYVCECGNTLGSHDNDMACKVCPCPRFVGGLDHSQLQCALADARLALAEYQKSEADLGDALGARIQEVARLTEERDTEREMREEAEVQRESADRRAAVLNVENNQQREDIRRLVAYVKSLPGTQAAAIYAELKERYDA